MIIANTSGQGVISASLVSGTGDSLASVAGTAQKADGTPGGALSVTPTGLPLALPSNTLLVLTNAPTRIAVSSPDLKPGLLAEVTLTFSKAGPVTMLVPVVSSSEPEYEGINVTG